MNENENNKNIWDEGKIVIGEQFIAVNIYI